MGIPLTRQLYAMLYAILCGIVCGGIYDLFRLLRVCFGINRYSVLGRKLYSFRFPLIGEIRRPDTGNIVRWAQFLIVFAGDVLYAILVGCIFSVFLYVAASGCFRWFYLFFACVGFLVYFFTIGKVVMSVSDVLICILRIGFRYALYFSLLPFRFLLKMWRASLLVLFRRIVQPIRKRAYVARCRRYTLQLKKNLYRLIRIS